MPPFFVSYLFHVQRTQINFSHVSWHEVEDVLYYVAVEVSSSSCSALLFAHYVRVCLLAHVSVFHPVMIVKEIYMDVIVTGLSCHYMLSDLGAFSLSLFCFCIGKIEEAFCV